MIRESSDTTHRHLQPLVTDIREVNDIRLGYKTHQLHSLGISIERDRPSLVCFVWWAITDSNRATSPCEGDRISNHSKAYILVEPDGIEPLTLTTLQFR